jgi:hypothetical protein
MFDSASLYGCEPQMPSIGIAAPTQQMGTDDLRVGINGLLDPKNPLLWLGGFLLVTVGAASIAGSARLGKVSVAVGAGK